MDEQKHIVFLAGFMGSGKSTIGPELAKRLHYEFIDIDCMIEESEKSSIAEIFDRHGEEYFRSLEQEMLNRFSHIEKRMVVALGGGTLEAEGNRMTVKRDGVLVYVRANRREILARVQNRKDRPMLLGPKGEILDESQLSRRVESLLREREKHYLEANIIVNTANLEVPETVEEIASKLRGKIE